MNEWKRRYFHLDRKSLVFFFPSPVRRREPRFDEVESIILKIEGGKEGGNIGGMKNVITLRESIETIMMIAASR